MKKIILGVLTFILCTILLAGCGGEGVVTTRMGRDYFVIEETEKLLSVPEGDGIWRLLGMQFYEDEIVQFWGESVTNEQRYGSWNVYRYREDGSSEFLFGSVASKYRSGWNMDGEGNYLILLGDTLVKLDGAGKELYSKTYDKTFLNLYRSDSDKWMLVGKTAEGAFMVSELNAETGEVADKMRLPLEAGGVQYLTGQQDGLYLMDSEGVWKFDVEQGYKKSVLSFRETQYDLMTYPIDFRVMEDGRIEILQTGKVITLERVNLGETREVVMLRSAYYHPQMKKYVDQFNLGSAAYYVVMEEYEGGSEGVDTFKEKTGIQLATGEGADIVFVGTSVKEPLELMGKGAFEKLNPYMEQAGVAETDYFPVAFEALRDGADIYGISVLIQPKGMWISEEALGGLEIPGFENLMDRLLSGQGTNVFWEHWDSGLLLNYLLQASDTLFGIVDWEKGVCDFEGELFAKILQVAKVYGADAKSKLPDVAGRQVVAGFYDYVSLAQRKSEGQVAVGYFFDDGAHVGDNTVYTMAISSNAVSKDGAWAFMEYLLNGEFQTSLSSNEYPVNRNAFEELARLELEEGSALKYEDENGREKYVFKAGTTEYESVVDAINDFDNYRANHDLTKEIVDEIREVLEDTRAFPIRIVPILNIISEEAGAYFSDAKKIEEVCRIIQNRVQLYLDEHN